MGLLAVAGDDPEPSWVVLQFKYTRNFWQKTNHIHTSREELPRAMRVAMDVYSQDWHLSTNFDFVCPEKQNFLGNACFDGKFESSRCDTASDKWNGEKDIIYLHKSEMDTINQKFMRAFCSYLRALPAVDGMWHDPVEDDERLSTIFHRTILWRWLHRIGQDKTSKAFRISAATASSLSVVFSWRKVIGQILVRTDGPGSGSDSFKWSLDVSSMVHRF